MKGLKKRVARCICLRSKHLALDHYVSQVHLRKFYAEAANFRKMFAYRKSDGAQFPCGAEDVCRIEGGSTNTFLNESRILEEFLEKVEPHYSRACESLSSGNVQMDDVLVIAGFASFVIGCSPTAMRLGSCSLNHLAQSEIELMDGIGILDLAPAELGGRTATQLLQTGEIFIQTDQKYPQAMGISGIVELTKSFATFSWEILINSHAERFPFLTSDYPAAIDGIGRQAPANRIIPLRPDLAVRILPQIRPPHRPDLPSDFRYRFRRVSPSEVTEINRAVVRSSENLVFSPVKAPWVSRLVRINAKYRLELQHARFPKGSGFLLVNSTVVKEIDQKGK